MDTDNDNIFAAGTSGPESNAANGSAKHAVNGSGVEGRIDPALARATTIEGGTPEPTRSTTSAPGSDATTSTTGPEQPTGSTARGRGRPRLTDAERAQRTAEKGEARNIRASFIERMLYSIHLGVANIASAPEFKIDKDDAKELGEAIAGVMALHKIKITPAQEAYTILFEAAAKVYPPMMITYMVRKQQEAKQRRANMPPRPSATVTPIRPQQAPPPPPQPPRNQPPPSAMPVPFDPANITIPDGA